MASDGYDRAVVQAAHEEWEYTTAESHLGPDFDQDVSIPCQLRFTGDVDQDTERFHDELENRGFVSVDSRPARKQTEDRAHYDGEIASEEHYHRVKVLVFRRGVVRLYPLDDYVPTDEELADVVEALEAGFGAELTHDPIEEDDTE